MAGHTEDQGPEGLAHASVKPTGSPSLTRVGVVAVGLALSQLPWSCAGIGAVDGPSTVTHADFILLRACSVAPAIGSAVLAIALLLARRRGAHRALAQAALLVSFLVLLLLDYAIHWHAGD